MGITNISGSGEKDEPSTRSDGGVGGLNMMKSKNQLYGSGRMEVIALLILMKAV